MPVPLRRQAAGVGGPQEQLQEAQNAVHRPGLEAQQDPHHGLARDPPGLHGRARQEREHPALDGGVRLARAPEQAQRADDRPVVQAGALSGELQQELAGRAAALGAQLLEQPRRLLARQGRRRPQRPAEEHEAGEHEGPDVELLLRGDVEADGARGGRHVHGAPAAAEGGEPHPPGLVQLERGPALDHQGGPAGGQPRPPGLGLAGLGGGPPRRLAPPPQDLEGRRGGRCRGGHARPPAVGGNGFNRQTERSRSRILPC